MPARLARFVATLLAVLASPGFVHAAQGLGCDAVAARLEGVPDTPQAVRVAVDFVVLELLDIDDTSGTFDVDMLVSARWEDPRITPEVAAGWRLAGLLAQER